LPRRRIQSADEPPGHAPDDLTTLFFRVLLHLLFIAKG